MKTIWDGETYKMAFSPEEKARLLPIIAIPIFDGWKLARLWLMASACRAKDIMFWRTAFASNAAAQQALLHR